MITLRMFDFRFLDKLSRILFIFLIRRIPTEIVREFYGRDFLAPVEQFVLDGYNGKIYNRLSLENESTAIILGGFIGISASELEQLYGCNIIIFEPIPQFAQILRNKFNDYSNITVNEIALSNKTGTAHMNLKGESSSILPEGQTMGIEIPTLAASEYFAGLEMDIDFLEINIEGSEYEVLIDLITTGKIRKVRSLAIQFHNLDSNSEFLRAVIRKDLRKTHSQKWSYDWVWEYWERTT